MKLVFFLTWSSTCVVTNSSGEGRFTITDTKLYVTVVTLSTQDNAKLFQQLKSGFRRTIKLEQILIRSKNVCTKQIFKSLS